MSKAVKQCVCWVPGHIGERCPVHALTAEQLNEIVKAWNTPREGA